MNNSALGGTWEDLQNELLEKGYLTQEEIAASDLRVSLIGEIINARHEKGITQKELEEISGVQQPVIARIESGRISPQIDTILKVLVPLGKKLAVVPLNMAKQ